MTLRLTRYSAWACALFAVLDACSTWTFLHNRTGTEGNPLASYGFAMLGVLPMLALFTLLRVMVPYALVRWYFPVWPRCALYLTLALCAWWGWVVAHNVLGGAFG